MTTAEPLLPHPGDDDERVAAADPGAGAPPPAGGTGVGAEEPGTTEESAGPEDRDLPRDVPFRTPEPTDLQSR